MPVSAASHWLAVCAPNTACTVSAGRKYGAAESRIESRSATDPPESAGRRLFSAFTATPPPLPTSARADAAAGFALPVDHRSLRDKAS
jgi:hypothetical protein